MDNVKTDALLEHLFFILYDLCDRIWNLILWYLRGRVSNVRDFAGVLHLDASKQLTKQIKNAGTH